jgi:hypothetical protein
MATQSLPQPLPQIEQSPQSNARLVSAAALLLRWWMDAGQPDPTAPRNDEEFVRLLYDRTSHSPMSFEDYRRRMSALLGLSLEGGAA